MKNRASYHGVEGRCWEPDDMAQMPDGGLYGAMRADEALAQAWDREELPEDLDACLSTVLRLWHATKREHSAISNRRTWLLTVTFHLSRNKS